MPRILIAPNAFKGSLSAVEAALVIKSSIDSLGLNLTTIPFPIADGGDGTIDVINFNFPESKFVNHVVYDPLMRKIKTRWLILEEAEKQRGKDVKRKKIGVIELSKASGMSLLKKEELNPFVASTYGTGQLILDALNKGCKKIIISLGGSATIDTGLGLISALGGKILDKKRNVLEPIAKNLLYIKKIDLTSVDKRIKNCSIDVLCDVKSCLVGKDGTINFARQKGAKANDLQAIESRMNHFADIVSELIHYDYRYERMVGSAGGTAFSLKFLLGAKLFHGFSYISNLILLKEQIKASDLVISGEGSLDAQSLMGKGVIELAKICKKYKKKVIVLCGKYDNSINWSKYGIDFIFPIKPKNINTLDSMYKAKKLIKKAIKTKYRLLFELLREKLEIR